ncbi:MAG: crossover junction endodeoxyribonuclease RuvC [Gemmatimonadales bacterium]
MLGIDPGTGVMGYGVIEGGGPADFRNWWNAVIRTNARQPLPDRLRTIHEGLAELFERHRPAALAVEDIFTEPTCSDGRPRHACGVILLGALAGIPVFGIRRPRSRRR